MSELLAAICGHFMEQGTNMANPITKLKKINVVKFRGLKNINIEFGSRLTVICGKNGTSKS
ncbi:ATP-binding protein, partial [Salmonella enterica]|nr:ATP-binding protein [Salmonella enterica]